MKKWYARAISGESRLIKTFWLGAFGFVALGFFYLQFLTVAIVFDTNLYTSDLLAGKSTFNLLRPALILLVLSVLFGLYTTFAAASIWQSADKYPTTKWAIWPNLAFFLTVLGSIGASSTIMFGLNTIVSTFWKVYTHGAM